MSLGKVCRYAGDCTVYQNENDRIQKPIFLIKNVFCNRGYKGWTNCKRFTLYEQGENVGAEITPYD